jgi:hypothetical protein
LVSNRSDESTITLSLRLSSTGSQTSLKPAVSSSLQQCYEKKGKKMPSIGVMRKQRTEYLKKYMRKSGLICSYNVITVAKLIV